MRSGAIPDGQISASSEYSVNYTANRARLYIQPSRGKSGAWLPKYNDANQWLQVDLGNNETRITRVATQGKSGFCCQWVTKFKLQYSDDGVNFTYYREEGQNASKVKCT